MPRGPRKVLTPGATDAPETPPASTASDAEPAAATDTRDLPDEKDVDPSKITKSVMTKQGWVCPGTPKQKSGV